MKDGHPQEPGRRLNCLRGRGKAAAGAVGSDGGPEIRGHPDRYPYELFLQHQEIAHRTTGCETIEIPRDLKAYVKVYNRRRPHRRRAMECSTPYHRSKAGLKEARSPAKTRKEGRKNLGSLDPPLARAQCQAITIILQTYRPPVPQPLTAIFCRRSYNIQIHLRHYGIRQ